MAEVLFLIGILLYYGLSFLLFWYLNRKLKNSWWAFRCHILSIAYALLIGPGFIGGGGEPGFALPVPILFVPWFTFEGKDILDGAVLPFLFWWCLIFLVMVIARIIKLLSKPKGTQKTDSIDS